MQKNYLIVKRAVILCLMFFCILPGCNKVFDAPPKESIGEVPVNFTIKALKELHLIKGGYELINDDKVISGIVTANDQSGNFYKQIIIQDATGAIPVRIEGNGLYTSYPVGRKVFIKLKGLMISDYGGVIQLGAGIDNSDPAQPELAPIASTLANQYITKGSLDNEVIPLPVSLTQLTANMQDTLQSRLIILDGFQFRDADLAKTYADTTKQVSAQNFSLQNCEGKNMTLRNSSYASFAGLKVPPGNGSIVAIYGIYSTTKQITIRDTSDIHFAGTRCTGINQNANIVSIGTIRQLAENSMIPDNTQLQGIVVSDSRNEAAGNYRIEQVDGSAGIQVRLISDDGFAPGQKLSVEVGGLLLENYNGDLQINDVPYAGIIGTGSITPRVVTTTDIIAHQNAWSSMLVTIPHVNFTAAGTTATGKNYYISDDKGSIATFVRNSAEIHMPLNAASVTGYVTIYQPEGGGAVAQLVLRDQSDISDSLPNDQNNNTGSSMTEDFEKASKRSYAGNATAGLTTGNWILSDEVIIGSSENDLKKGDKSPRLRGVATETGEDAFVAMDFDMKGMQEVSFFFGGATFAEGSDEDKVIKIEVFQSTDGGNTWTSIGTRTGERGSFTQAAFDTHAQPDDNVRIKIANASYMRTGGRLKINVDDVMIAK